MKTAWGEPGESRRPTMSRGYLQPHGLWWAWEPGDESDFSGSRRNRSCTSLLARLKCHVAVLTPIAKDFPRSSIKQILAFHAEYFVTSKAERRRAWAISEIGRPLIADENSNGDGPLKEEESLEDSSVKTVSSPETVSHTSTTTEEEDAKVRGEGKVEKAAELNVGGDGGGDNGDRDGGGGGYAKRQDLKETSAAEKIQGEDGNGKIDETNIP